MKSSRIQVRCLSIPASPVDKSSAYIHSPFIWVRVKAINVCWRRPLCPQSDRLLHVLFLVSYLLHLAMYNVRVLSADSWSYIRCYNLTCWPYVDNYFGYWQIFENYKWWAKEEIVLYLWYEFRKLVGLLYSLVCLRETLFVCC